MNNKIISVSKRFLRNISFCIHHDLGRELSNTDYLYSKVKELQFLLISQYQRQVFPINDELSRLAMCYTKETGIIDLVPYYLREESNDFDSGFSDGFPYVVHKGKKLFFPISWDIDRVKSFYANYLNKERIISKESGIGPHQYQSDCFKIEENDILVDIGCAEALLALDVIDIINKAYLVENDPAWIEPLQKTFSSFSSKVKIISKTIGSKDDEKECTLSTLLKDVCGSPLFIKMDIEGGEIGVLQSSKDFLAQHGNVKIASCTYHRISDYDEIKSLLESLGYKCSCSTGYILTSFLDSSGIPSLRRGVIRAEK